MPFIDVQQICLNGHQITDGVARHSENARKFCPVCGVKTITSCPNCNAPIPGHKYYDGVVAVYTEKVPSHCHNCGAAYPWTEKNQTTITISEKEFVYEPYLLVEKLCTRFHLVVRQLKNRHDNRETLNVKDEYDVQDLLHAILKFFFNDIRPEEWTPSYAGKSSRMDFLIPEHDLVIETKMTRSGLGTNQIGDQLIVDIGRYKSHKQCKVLVCFVYDPDAYINNPSALERDLSGKREGLNVKVMVVPKGY